jgi:hypothetical protein
MENLIFLLWSIEGDRTFLDQGAVRRLKVFQAGDVFPQVIELLSTLRFLQTVVHKVSQLLKLAKGLLAGCTIRMVLWSFFQCFLFRKKYFSLSSSSSSSFFSE